MSKNASYVGLELIGAIRKNPTLRETRIIVFTGYGSEETMNEAIEAGADVFMSKVDVCADKRFESHVLSAIARCLLWLALPSFYLDFKKSGTRLRKADAGNGQVAKGKRMTKTQVEKPVDEVNWSDDTSYWPPVNAC